MVTKVYILTHKDNEHEEDVIKQMKNVITIAAQISNAQVDIEVTHEFGAFEGVSMDPTKTPIIIIHKQVQFTTKPPPVDLIRQCFSQNNNQMPGM